MKITQSVCSKNRAKNIVLVGILQLYGRRRTREEEIKKE